MLVLASIKCESPFDQSAYQGSGRSSCASKKEPMRHAQTPNLASAQTWLPQTPGVVYACYTGRIEKRAAHRANQPQKFSQWWFPHPPNMGYGLFNFGRNLILPPSSFPRLAGESGTNVHVLFLKTIQEFLQWSTAQPRTCHFPSFRRIPIIPSH